MKNKPKRRNLLEGARVYLSGPMDFVFSRAAEKKFGWRTRIGEFLRSLGVTVFDPWNKPSIRGLWAYGIEDEKSAEIREIWRFNRGRTSARARAACAEKFWQTMHIDLRMVDVSDFVIAYCPSNIYSVGTPHEIILARQQKKPVLFVSPPVVFRAWTELRKRLEERADLPSLLDNVEREIPIKENPGAIPSLWYMPLIGSQNFFDGFGFALYRARFRWTAKSLLDHQEQQFKPKRPLLPFLESIARGRYPRKWDSSRDRLAIDDDWLLMDHALKLRKV